MEPLNLLLIFLGIALVAGVAYLAVSVRKLTSGSGHDTGSLQLLQNQMAQLQKELGDRMGETNQAVRQSFATSSGLVRDVTERMTKVEEISRQVLTETNELQKLQQMLKNPKQRGVLGEYFLETLLKNVMPPESFQMQYRFADGEIVDAVVFVKDKIVPIDSKFSLENYNRLAVEENATERDRLEKLFVNDLKERVKETSKYIRPNESTMDFAFMFIPHEAIYYDLLVNKIGAVTEDTENIIQRAAAKYHVLVVSPTSFLAYLQTVLQGLRALQIEEQAVEVIKRVGELGKHLAAYETHFKGLGSNLATVVNKYNFADKEFAKIDKDVLKLTGASDGYEPLQIDKPATDA
ncbi:DNA recombination protein RmuC [Patescibacteria group bacterium]|nr:DNA recombination protein RmuC [Patescibacteria group bacterium]MBU1448748.1 DNA recombination protein RmuC [Patescibacteria group bacterium]MBU2613581.1 DNA recombination protein RmuC [Patescibacteria group bacterium]